MKKRAGFFLIFVPVILMLFSMGVYCSAQPLPNRSTCKEGWWTVHSGNNTVTVTCGSGGVEVQPTQGELAEARRINNEDRELERQKALTLSEHSYFDKWVGKSPAQIIGGEKLWTRMVGFNGQKVETKIYDILAPNTRWSKVSKTVIQSRFSGEWKTFTAYYFFSCAKLCKIDPGFNAFLFIPAAEGRGPLVINAAPRGSGWEFCSSLRHGDVVSNDWECYPRGNDPDQNEYLTNPEKAAIKIYDNFVTDLRSDTN